MIHYTVLPHELIYLDPDQPQADTKEVVIDGVTVEVLMNTSGQAQIVRLLSSDPEHFLNPRLQPGSQISMVPSV
ncbi:YlzJ-like family protein [Mechercharimyces sp. CAU 1602]|uniref:YlzJ-like family protein n=1 Tax=Mechercharimyces sp. CAU 1602 TaxID=2973933 RepID=UPI002161CF56|nr:YlzJ-like family protein [Mechercharimyces sp. CAU 1602]MCS1351251.1 YlzJ-like family protein [Mechercharimyces sp. CAU 1602]